MRTSQKLLAAVVAGLAAGACSAEVLSVDVDATRAVDAEGVRADAFVPPDCEPKTCEDIGWACGRFVTCGQVVDCADEGFTCEVGESCMGGHDGPTECVAADGVGCEVCSAIPDCSGEAQPTRLAGRVVTPGRDDGDTANQVGVPNAVVYILRTRDPGDLPALPTGLPAGESRCDRCEDQGGLLGPFLTGAVTDASGRFEIEGDIPVGEEIVLVVNAGKFRRATTITVPAEDACSGVELPVAVGDNPARLPRSTSDGLAVNIPRIVVTTGQIDAMECVLEKIGLDAGEFGNPGTEARIHLYRGADGEAGMRIDDTTPADTQLYGQLGQLEGYDMLIADCEGLSWDSGFEERDQFGDHVREYVNRGGRLFASHLSFSWLHENGAAPFDPNDPVGTGLGAVASFQDTAVSSGETGIVAIALGRERASPRIDSFAAWMDVEGVSSPPDHDFEIRHPRSQAQRLGPHSDEFVFCESGDCTHETQQFSFDTPYGAPGEEACGRVAYSGFHVAPAEEGGGNEPYGETVFPEGCAGDLTDQEKVLLFMLFDLAACIGDPLRPPECEPRECGGECGFVPDGCGDLIDCGLCPVE